MRTGDRETYGSDSAPADLVPEIQMIGRDRFPAAAVSALGSHQHPHAYEICYLADGLVDWWVEEERYTLRRGDLYITRPDERHGGAHTVMQPCELYWVQVPAPSLAPEWQEALESLSVRVIGGVCGIPELFEVLLAEHRDRSRYAAPAARAALQTLLIRVLRAAEASGRAATTVSPVIAQALQLLAADLSAPCTVEEVARQVGLSSSRLVARFLEETGETPGEWRVRRRLEAAKVALRHTRDPITTIAHRFGFSSSQYFATVFRRNIGLSPTAWRVEGEQA